ncbi:unnamed protein product [Ectocarpus sp. 12 AP-2014]
MTEMLDFGWSERPYWDRKNWSSLEAYKEALKTSSTLYVGNLSFYTQESQIYALFDQVGAVRRVIMGLDRVKKSPCGFCFVEYTNHSDTLMAITCLDGTALDERIIKVGIDPGFKQGRQYGRGMSGGQQVRDEARATNDPARGGMGGLALAEMNGQLAPQGGGGGGGGGDYYGHGGGGGGDYYGGGGRANKRPRVDWDARDRR